MNVLRPLNVWRNITKLKHRFNVPTQPTVQFSFVSHARIVCIAQKPFDYFNVPYRSVATNNNHHQNQLNANSTSTNILLQLRQNIDPYARLMRIDRPIGKLRLSRQLFLCAKLNNK